LTTGEGEAYMQMSEIMRAFGLNEIKGCDLVLNLCLTPVNERNM